MYYTPISTYRKQSFMYYTPISTYRRLLIFIEFKILIVLTEILKTK